MAAVVGTLGLELKIETVTFLAAIRRATLAAERLQKALDAINDVEIAVSVVDTTPSLLDRIWRRVRTAIHGPIYDLA